MANMAPSWAPKSNPNRQKIDAKIDQKLDASWDRFVGGFCWILDRKMEACWHQNPSKIDVNFERRFFEKSYSRCSGGSIFQVRGVQVGSQNRSQIDQNLKSKIEGVLASSFHRFLSILGPKLGYKIEPRSLKNGIQKTMKKRRATRRPKSRNKKP